MQRKLLQSAIEHEKQKEFMECLARIFNNKNFTPFRTKHNYDLTDLKPEDYNANVVLGADAEEIIIANQDGIGTENAEKRFEYRSGAIKNDEILTDDNGTPLKGILNQNGIQTQICDILEGGRPAFKLRQNKYAGIQHD